MSESDISEFDPAEEDMIMEEIRRLKEEACSRRPTPRLRKVISLNKFVHEFEWLDTKHTAWFMNKTSKLCHQRLMAEMRREEEIKVKRQTRGTEQPPAESLAQCQVFLPRLSM